MEDGTEHIITEAPIEAVCVHRRGATVSRRVRVEAIDGRLPRQIAIVGLPLALQAATVRVTVEAVDGDGAALAGDPRVGLYARPAAETAEPPEVTELRAAERAVTRGERRLAQIDAELRALAQAGIDPRPDLDGDRAPPPSPMGARLALVGFVDDLSERRHAERAALEATLAADRETLESLRDRARRASSARVIDAAAITARIALSLDAEGAPRAVTLAVSYFVPGAWWVPAWQVRLDRAGTAAAIELRAHVVQQSGEDWSGVRLRLSTAEPLRFSALPTLKAIRIGKAQDAPPARRGFRPPPQGSAALFADFDHARAALGPRAPGPVAALPAPSSALPGLPEWPAIEESYGGMLGGAAVAYAASELADDGADFDEEAPAESGAPPPPPAPRMAYRSAPAPAPARPAAPGGAMRKRSETRGSGGPPPEPVQAAVLFGALRLAPPAGAERGRLRPVDRAQVFRAELTADGRALTDDPIALVQRAEARARAVEHLAAPAGTLPVARSTGPYDYAWTADNPVDVPADGAWHAVPLGVRAADCALRYVTVPRESPHVFRLATLQNPTDAPLLAGPAEVYVDGAYVLSTALPTVPPGGRFELGLGVEQAIRCARNVRYEEARSDERVVAMAELRHAITVELKNGLGRPADVEVRERVPQPAEGAEVVIEELHVEPLWQGYDQTERGRPIVGGRRWRVEVPPGAERALKATYVVKIYAANELVGGNRREA